MDNFRQWLFENAGVMDRNRVSSNVGSPPEPPRQDDGDNDDDAEWEWSKVIAKYSNVIQAWLDSDPFAKKCKGAVLGKIFQVQPQVEVDIWTNERGMIDREGYLEMHYEWKCGDGPLPSMLHQVMQDPRQCTLWKPMGIVPEQWYATLDKGDLFDVIWHFFAMSITGTPARVARRR